MTAAGSFEFTVSGISGASYIIETSTNLVNWAPVETNAAPFLFLDANVTQYACRFFRAVRAP